MGRGLSDQQKTILRVAYQGRLRRMEIRIVGPEIDALVPELLAACFGWEPRSPFRRPWREAGEDCERLNAGQHFFSRESIGRDTYNAARASMSRALRRLAARGLLEVEQGLYCGWTGVWLTEAGLRVAEELPPSATVPR